MPPHWLPLNGLSALVFWGLVLHWRLAPARATPLPGPTDRAAPGPLAAAPLAQVAPPELSRADWAALAARALGAGGLAGALAWLLVSHDAALHTALNQASVTTRTTWSLQLAVCAAVSALLLGRAARHRQLRHQTLIAESARRDQMTDMLAQASTAFVLVDGQGRYVWINAAASRVLNAPHEALMALNLFESPVWQANGLVDRMRRSLAGEQVPPTLHDGPGTLGQELHTKISHHRITLGGVHYLLAEITDRSADFAREAAERATHARIEALMQASAEAIFVIDLHGQVLDANPAFAALLRRPPEQARGLHLRELDQHVSQMEQATLERHLVQIGRAHV